MVRLLLPFTHGIDSSAITAALALAQRLNATLTLLSLIHQPQVPGKGPRWEIIQQSQDFLEFTSHKAARAGVPVERVEQYTRHIPRSIRAFAQEMECAGIVLTVRRGAGVLLATHEAKQILEEKCVPIFVVSLPTRNSFFSALQRFARRFSRKGTDPNSSNSVLRWQAISHQAAYQSHDSHVPTDS